MKIGILTFQPSLNYGGILQCLALKQTLEAMGHSVSVFRRSTPWFDSTIDGPYPMWGKRQWLKFAIRSAFGLGDFRIWLRYHRTQRFRANKLSIMPWKLRTWNDAPSNLNLDLIVVGSDMVWHCGDWGNPAPFLLEEAPVIPAIAYSASFGMKELPEQIGEGPFEGDDIHSRYRKGLAKFSAISCRESEGVQICSLLGFKASHVVDPSLLPDFGSPRRKTDGKLLVAYLLTHSPSELLSNVSKLETFARKRGLKVRVFVREGITQRFPSPPFPISPKKAVQWFAYLWRQMTSHAEIRGDAGPREFLATLREARWMVTDSFHGLMFAMRNNCDIRILNPTNAERSTIFSRIGEFASHIDGPLFSNGIDEALASIERGEKVTFDYEWLNSWRAKSRNWLEVALVKAVK
ncbi:MAG: polysaccharide pyruvyl transferase family protein [Victivallales bacterium]|nr:polysaccharide pyruvyl transferase family protein [Victivallales bacterium]